MKRFEHPLLHLFQLAAHPGILDALEYRHRRADLLEEFQRVQGLSSPFLGERGHLGDNDHSLFTVYPALRP